MIWYISRSTHSTLCPSVSWSVGQSVSNVSTFSRFCGRFSHLCRSSTARDLFCCFHYTSCLFWEFDGACSRQVYRAWKWRFVWKHSHDESTHFFPYFLFQSFYTQNLIPSYITSEKFVFFACDVSAGLHSERGFLTVSSSFHQLMMM